MVEENGSLEKYLPYISMVFGIIGIILSAVFFIIIYIAVDSVEKPLSEQIDGVAKILGSLENSVLMVEGEADNLGESASKINSSIVALEKGVRASGESFVELGNGISAIPLIPGTSEKGQKIKDAGNELIKSSIAMRGFANSIDPNVKKIYDIKGSLSKIREGVRDEKNSVFSLKDQLKNFFFLSKIASFVLSLGIMIMFIVLILVARLQMQKL